MRQGYIWALLIIAAAARLWMAAAALPPFWGLDEKYHVARLEFVQHEHRNPTMTEKSMPSGPNYEAQQPSLYYSLFAPLGGLGAWRAVSVLFALIVVIATAFIGHRFAGTPGILAAATVFMLPTWFTLVIRASNDAMACAFVAVAIALTVADRSAVAEGVAWGLALATKLYTWPVAIILPFFWWRQRATRWRVITVCVICAIAVLGTMLDLSQRTSNPLGHFGFDKPQAATSAGPPIRVLDMIKITIASGIWTSGPHNDAMRPLAMAIYVLPLIAVVAIRRETAAEAGGAAQILVIALITFGLAQLVDALAFARQARAAGIDLPLGGKEGWYWYVLTPLAVPILFSRAPRLIAAWLLLWDIVITEGALFHAYAGTTSAAHPSLLFRWGPLQAPFTAGLPVYLLVLRGIEVAALIALFLQGSSSDDRHRFADSPVAQNPH